MKLEQHGKLEKIVVTASYFIYRFAGFSSCLIMLYIVCIDPGGEIDNPQPQMVHLAKQIIAAMPERIKSSPSRGDEIQTEEFQRERSSSYSSIQSSASPHAPSSYGEALSSYGEDSGISTPMHDSLAFDEYR